MRVLIAERSPGGHRLVYIGLLVRRARQLGMEVDLVLSQPVLATKEYAMHLSDVEAEIHVTPKSSSADFLTDIENVAKAQGVVHVILPDGDALALRVGVRWHGPPVTCLIMRNPYGESASLSRIVRNGAKRAALRWAGSRRGVRVVRLAQFGDLPGRGHTHLAFDPYISSQTSEDLASEALVLRRQLGMSTDVTWFVMVGALSRRKNIRLVIDALVQANAAGASVGLVLFGPHDENVEQDLQSVADHLPYQVIISDSVKTNDQINAMVHAADVIVTAYDIHYPNSTLVKALVAGTRVVVAGSSFVRTRALRTDHRVRTSKLDAKEMAAAFIVAMQDTPPVRRVDFDDRQFTDALLRRWW